MPTNYWNHVDQARKLLAEKSYANCHEHCIAALNIDPNGPEPFFLLSILTSDHQNFSKALEIVERAIGDSTDDPRYLAQRAKCLTALNRHGEALQDALSASALDPDDVFSLDTLGVVFSRVGEHAKAVPFFQSAAKRSADNPDICYNLGASAQFSGQFALAEAAYLRAIELRPNFYKAYYGLTSLGRKLDDLELLSTMKKLFDDCEDADDRLHLGHAIARMLEHQEKYEQSFDYLNRAKQRKRDQLNYSFDVDAALFHAAKAQIVDQASSQEQQGGRPIFVVGMPRTGTTLVDRILSSHSCVSSAGELTLFGLLLKQATKTNSQFILDVDTLNAVNAVDLQAVGASYLEATDRFRKGVSHSVDKMPLNFFYTPIILNAIPSARVICLLRDPMDVCLSNFKQLFRTSYSYYNYAHDIETTAQYVSAFRALIKFWSDTLPDHRFTTIEYESIIANQKAETQRLLDFVELPFEEQCLNFHRNSEPVATASSVQVRRPLYSSSIGKWKKYGESMTTVGNFFEQ